MKICAFLVLFLFSHLGLRADHFLTFIIPCYNSEKWVGDAIESIYKQDLKCPFEVICTDDGSSDGTFALLSDLSRQLPELKVMQHPQNRGGGAARNTCVLHSKGDIIFCLDSDNVLLSQSVQKLIDRMDETNADVVSFGGIQYFNNVKLEIAFQYSMPCDGYTLQDILHDPNSPPWSGNYLYTRKSFDLVGGYPELTIDTFGFGFLQALHGCKMVLLPNTCYLHRCGVEGYFVRSTKSNKLQIDFFNLLLAHKNILREESVKLLKKHRKLAMKKKEFKNQIWFLEHKLIQLK